MRFGVKLFFYALFGLLLGQVLLGYGLSQEPAIGDSSGAYSYSLFRFETLLSTTCLFLVLGILREGVGYIKGLNRKESQAVL